MFTAIEAIEAAEGKLRVVPVRAFSYTPPVSSAISGIYDPDDWGAFGRYARTRRTAPPRASARQKWCSLGRPDAYPIVRRFYEGRRVSLVASHSIPASDGRQKCVNLNETRRQCGLRALKLQMAPCVSTR